MFYIVLVVLIDKFQHIVCCSNKDLIYFYLFIIYIYLLR